jgi:hypothetical protein
MSLSESVAAIVKVYAKNPQALAKALEGLVESQIEKRDVRSTKLLAEATCRKLHPEPSERVICEGCFDAALEKINGE